MPLTATPQWIDRACQLAGELQTLAAGLQTTAERRQQAELDRMLQNIGDKATLAELTDQAFRSHNAARVADQFTHILDVQGIPRFFSPLDRVLMRGFQTFGGWLPGVTVPLVMDQMRHETANVVLPAERELLADHLAARHREGVRMNLNFLGESLMGEEEAEARLSKYLAALAQPEVEVLSVKISTIYSQIMPIAWEHTVAVLCDRMERLYREAAHLQFTRPDGKKVPKFVYLDMEEYRDLRLTAEAFMRTLDRPGLTGVGAGIALQAYIPDSHRVQCEINAWARRRIERGGAPITIRLVKGANMEMERVEASLRGWPQAPYKSKCETDANYKRMLHEALAPENLAAVRVGIASHNLFDLAYGLVVTEAANAGDRVQFEMLEGMANHQRRALRQHARELLLYAPACRKEEFINAIGYLIRRLDENTGPDNFLRHAFKIQVGGATWQRLQDDFRAAFEHIPDDAPRRTQNRLEPTTAPVSSSFANEPDTDFALPQNVEWARRIIAAWEPRSGAHAVDVPLVIAGNEVASGRAVRESHDPSRPGTVVARVRQATNEDIETAVAAAHADPAGWRRLSYAERSIVLAQAAQELRQARADLIGAALAEGGKLITESDPEISEAVDFVEYYARCAADFAALPDTRATGRGVIVVVSPWNFPIAIPCGGIAAALAAGNTVLLKPASDTALVAWEMCQCFWRAGVSRHTLQFVPCSGGGPGQQLVGHVGVDGVILTGGTSTALHMLQARPSLRLMAETGGKNATIVTAMADREQAIKHVVHSAFSHSGQKCSATSLLLLEAEVYDDPQFQRQLVDAVTSLAVGSAWERTTRVGPLIRPPMGELETGLMTLEPGESWAVLPRRSTDSPQLWSPGVKWGVSPGSFTHRTEFFGPLLGVMRFERLSEAIELVNQTGYGLTSGLQSLDDREQLEWKEKIVAGNLYINKPTVGAIVERQPFGGYGKSCFGPGLKAGSANYVAQLMNFEDRPEAVTPPQPQLEHPDLAALVAAIFAQPAGPTIELDRLLGALASYDLAWHKEFAGTHDPQRLIGEDNLRRYRPCREIRVRVHPEDDLFDVVARAAAARVTGARVIVSVPFGPHPPAVEQLDRWTEDWAGGIEFLIETDDALIEAMRVGHVERVRYASAEHLPDRVRLAAAETSTALLDFPPTREGRVELLWYLREQSVSHAYHRYGNLGRRNGESRAEPM